MSRRLGHKHSGMRCPSHKKLIIRVTGAPYYHKKGIHNLGAKFECADCIGVTK